MKDHKSWKNLLVQSDTDIRLADSSADSAYYSHRGSSFSDSTRDSGELCIPDTGSCASPLAVRQLRSHRLNQLGAQSPTSLTSNPAGPYPPRRISSAVPSLDPKIIDWSAVISDLTLSTENHRDSSSTLGDFCVSAVSPFVPSIVPVLSGGPLLDNGLISPVQPRAPFPRLPVKLASTTAPAVSSFERHQSPQLSCFREKFECTYCPRRFIEEGYRNHHEKQKHDFQYTFTCLHDECIGGKHYNSKKEGLEKHRRSAHKDCLETDCQKCLVGQQVIVRPPKKAAACGICGALFRAPKTLLVDRAEHIHSHYSGKIKDAKYLFFWKQRHWKKSNIIKAFLRQPEIHRFWRAYKTRVASDISGFKFDLSWDNCTDDEWEKFIFLAEFGGADHNTAYFSPAHAQTIVDLAYALARKDIRQPGQTTPYSSRTHSRASSNVDNTSDQTWYNDSGSFGDAAISAPTPSNPANLNKFTEHGLPLRPPEQSISRSSESPSIDPVYDDSATFQPWILERADQIDFNDNFIRESATMQEQQDLSSIIPEPQRASREDLQYIQFFGDLIDFSSDVSHDRDWNRRVRVFELPSAHDLEDSNALDDNDPTQAKRSGRRAMLLRKQ
jgi:hypothetical protein